MLKTNKAEKRETKVVEGFNAQTRCDKCGAQAYIYAWKAEMGLYFCIHHGDANFGNLALQGFQIDDRRHALR